MNEAIGNDGIPIRDDSKVDTHRDLDRATSIDQIETQNRTAFVDWFKTKDKTELSSIPKGVLKFLIPRAVLEHADNPTAVDINLQPGIRPDPDGKYVDDRLAFFVTESMGDDFTDAIPEINTQLGLSVHDKIIFFSFLGKTADQLHVYRYDSNAESMNKGIATGFYEKLEALARELGCKYITGDNDQVNVGYFINKLGRVPLNSLPAELKSHLEAPMNIHREEEHPHATVKVLDPV